MSEVDLPPTKNEDGDDTVLERLEADLVETVLLTAKLPPQPAYSAWTPAWTLMD